MERFGSNKQIAETLNGYLNFDNPGFAFLITGKWGCGKTRFIDDYIDYYTDNYTVIKGEAGLEPPKICKISLFGISKPDEIDKHIFKSFHPVLESKKVKALGKIGSFCIDKIPFTFGLPIKNNDIEKVCSLLKSFCPKHQKNAILIMDDFERCDIDPQNLLGYINNQIEEYNAKVVIIACPEKIGNKCKFDEFREKVIGQTVNIIPNVEIVFETEICSIKDENIKSILNKNKKVLIDIFNNSKCNNLRNIRKLFYEFASLYKKIDDKFIKDLPLINNILCTNFIMSIENNMFPEKISKFFKDNPTAWPINYTGFGDKKNTYFSNLDKYKINNFALQPSFWGDFLENGIISKDELDKFFETSLKTTDSKEYLPLKLWDLFTLNDDDFKENYHKLIEGLKGKIYQDLGIFLHAAGLVFVFEKYKLLPDDFGNTEDFLNQCLDGLKFDISDNTFKYILFSGCYGKQYHESDDPRFNKIKEKAQSQYNRQEVDEISRRLNGILNLLNTNFNEVIEKLIEKINKFNGFYVANIEVSDFVATIEILENDKLAKFWPVFCELLKRHIDSQYNKNQNIMSWIEKLIKSLQTLSSRIEKPLYRISLGNFIMSLNNLSENRDV